MTRLTVGILLIATLAVPAHAGCVGPVIMGQCEGTSVPYDTHTDARERPDPPPAPNFYYDKRGTEEQRVHPNEINPFTGRDANDSAWGDRR